MNNDQFWRRYGRKCLRLPGYDYASPGLYYITIVTHDRERLLGQVSNGRMIRSMYGEKVHNHWRNLSYRYPNIRIDEFIVMPDHVHGIIEICQSTNDGKTDGDMPVGVDFADVAKSTPTRNVRSTARRRGIPEIIRGFKNATTISVNIDRNTPGSRIWQRNYYERIIRDDVELERTRQYIRNNPNQ